jgi:hypothetical protein
VCSGFIWLMAWSSERGDESFCSIKGKEFHDLLGFSIKTVLHEVNSLRLLCVLLLVRSYFRNTNCFFIDRKK